jgi:GT2 family glycosyltransferase
LGRQRNIGSLQKRIFILPHALNKGSTMSNASSSRGSAQTTGTISALVICSDRFEELIRGLASLEVLGDLLLEIRVLKNAPSIEWKEDRLDALPTAVREKLVILPSEQSLSCPAARNRLAEGSKGDAFLFLDDDAYLLELAGIQKGLEILQRDKSVGSIAYPQCDEKGVIIKNYAQPAPVDYPCLTNGFSGYAALVRAELYQKLGGFQEILQAYGEENEYCRRQWNLGYSVVYLPAPTVFHMGSKVERNKWQRAKFDARNAWYVALLHEPLWYLWFSLPRRILGGRSYLKWTNSWPDSPRQPLFRQALKEFFRDFPELVRRRTPLKLSTLRTWQPIKKTNPRYP